MPSKISWLPRIAEIRRAVTISSLSHYGRTDIEHVFHLKSRSANKLLETMPTVAMWGAEAVESPALLEFLDVVAETADVPALLARLRASKRCVSRKRPRTLVRRETLEGGLTAMPACASLARGRFEVNFTNTFELVEAVAVLLTNLNSDEDWYQFCRAYEPERPELPSESAYEAINLGRLALQCVKAGMPATAGRYASEAAHHGHWAQVERGTVSDAEYVKEMEALETVSGAMKAIFGALKNATEPVTFQEMAPPPRKPPTREERQRARTNYELFVRHRSEAAA